VASRPDLEAADREMLLSCRRSRADPRQNPIVHRCRLLDLQEVAGALDNPKQPSSGIPVGAYPRMNGATA